MNTGPFPLTAPLVARSPTPKRIPAAQPSAAAGRPVLARKQTRSAASPAPTPVATSSDALRAVDAGGTPLVSDAPRRSRPPTATHAPTRSRRTRGVPSRWASMASTPTPPAATACTNESGAKLSAAM